MREFENWKIEGFENSFTIKHVFLVSDFLKTNTQRLFSLLLESLL